MGGNISTHLDPPGQGNTVWHSSVGLHSIPSYPSMHWQYGWLVTSSVSQVERSLGQWVEPHSNHPLSTRVRRFPVVRSFETTSKRDLRKACGYIMQVTHELRLLTQIGSNHDHIGAYLLVSGEIQVFFSKHEPPQLVSKASLFTTESQHPFHTV